MADSIPRANRAVMNFPCTGLHVCRRRLWSYSAFLGGLDLKAGDLLQNLPSFRTEHIQCRFSFPLIFCNRATNLKDLLAFLAEKLVGWHITSAQYVAAITLISSHPETHWPMDAFRHQKVSTRSTSMDSCAASFGVVHLEFNHPRSSSVTPRALPQSPYV